MLWILYGIRSGTWGHGLQAAPKIDLGLSRLRFLSQIVLQGQTIHIHPQPLPGDLGERFQAPLVSLLSLPDQFNLALTCLSIPES
jgi:hypothetical protein